MGELDTAWQGKKAGDIGEHIRSYLMKFDFLIPGKLS